MNDIKNIVNNLTQKDEQKAIEAAKLIIESSDLNAFELLCEKSDFLYDFIKNNVKNRFKRVINNDNYINLLNFMKIYSEDYQDCILESLTHYANEELSDTMYNLLENGSEAEKRYASGYFSLIPDTIAIDIIKELAFSDDVILASNAASALKSMGDKTVFDKALILLKSNDDFEIMKGVNFLISFGDMSVLPNLLEALDYTKMPENLADSIITLIPLKQMINYNLNKTLNCFNHFLNGSGEIIPLQNILTYDIFEFLEYLVKRNYNEKNPYIANSILKAIEKFATFDNNDEYTFDETKDVKTEIKEISHFLESLNPNFIKEQKDLLIKNLDKDDEYLETALDTIRDLRINEAANTLINLLDKENDEAKIVKILGTIFSLERIKEINQQTCIISKIKDENLKAIAENYFVF